MPSNTLLRHPEIALQRLTLIANRLAADHPDGPKDAVLSDIEPLDGFGAAGLRIWRLPSDIPATELPLVRKAGRAQALVALQDRIAAHQDFRELITAYGAEPGVHYMYGVFLLKENQPQSVDEFRREIEISPTADAPRIQLALELLETANYQEG